MLKILTLLLPISLFSFVAEAGSHSGCKAITVSNMMGVSDGAYPQQFELEEFEKLAKCELSFSENPDIKTQNDRIRGNGSLVDVADRLPSEPLVVVPYDSIGQYGGTLRMLANATESGTSDLLSIRHVNFVRFSDDLQTIVPNVAKAWEWNSDFTELTFFLRAGHKWSDGAPFTADDVKFWYDNLMFDSNVREKPYDFLQVAGEKMEVEVVNDTTVKFILPAAKPGLLSHFATSYCQGFAPKHFLGQYHPDVNSNADQLAQDAGFENGYAVLSAYFGNSCWTDTPSPMLSAADKVENLPKDAYPSLEAYVTVGETSEGRRYAANPYFHMVDTQGNQLPYISEQNETFIQNNNEVRMLKLTNSEVEYLAQNLALEFAPQLLDGADKGNYTVDIKPGISIPVFSFNYNIADADKNTVFNDIRFREAMSMAIDRDAINDAAYFGLGQPQQYIPFSPAPSFVDAKYLSHKIGYDPTAAGKLLDEVGLVDSDGDGVREYNGKPFTLNMNFSDQGLPIIEAELVAQNWTDVGIKTTFKQVTTDEYRTAQSANELEVHLWKKGQPLPTILSTNELFVPPFENYFGHRNGMLWAEYLDTNGSSGVKPPQYISDMITDINEFQTLVVGSPESDTLGAKLVKTMTENLLFIGTVAGPAPIYHRNELQNFPEFKTASYEYYRTYPYRPQQWFIAD